MHGEIAELHRGKMTKNLCELCEAPKQLCGLCVTFKSASVTTKVVTGRYPKTIMNTKYTSRN